MTGRTASIEKPSTLRSNDGGDREDACIGVLCLDEVWPAQMPVGSLADPAALPVRSTAVFVPGSTLQRILEAPAGLVDDYICAAQTLEADGASLITSNCGYSVLFQHALSAACRVPVVSSSLLLLPSLLEACPAQQRIAILCFDSERLENRHLKAAGAANSEDRIDLYGLEGTESWRQITAPGGRYDWRRIGRDLHSIACRIAAENRHGAILVECCAFLPFSAAISRHALCPVYDLVSSIRCHFSQRLEPRNPDHLPLRFDSTGSVKAPLRPRRIEGDHPPVRPGIR